MNHLNHLRIAVFCLALASYMSYGSGAPGGPVIPDAGAPAAAAPGNYKPFKKMLAFLSGACALGGIVYASHVNEAPTVLAGNTILGSYLGSLFALGYINESPKSSLIASIAWSAAVATTGLLSVKLSKGETCHPIYSCIMGWILGNSVYYA